MGRRKGDAKKTIEELQLSNGKRKKLEDDIANGFTKKAKGDLTLEDIERLLSQAFPSKGNTSDPGIQGICMDMAPNVGNGLKIGDAEKTVKMSNELTSRAPEPSPQKEKEHATEEHKFHHRPWSFPEEMDLLSELADIAAPESGRALENSKIGWVELASKVSKRVGRGLTRSQVYEKARRLKGRYTSANYQHDEEPTFKDEEEELFYKLGKRIWGAGIKLTLQLEDEDDEETMLDSNKEKNRQGSYAESNPNRLLDHRANHEGVASEISEPNSDCVVSPLVKKVGRPALGIAAKDSTQTEAEVPGKNIASEGRDGEREGGGQGTMHCVQVEHPNLVDNSKMSAPVVRKVGRPARRRPASNNVIIEKSSDHHHRNVEQQPPGESVAGEARTGMKECDGQERIIEVEHQVLGTPLRRKAGRPAKIDQHAKEIGPPACVALADSNNEVPPKSTAREEANGGKESMEHSIQAEYRTIVDDVKTSCKGALQEMQASFLALMKQTAKEMGGGQSPVPWLSESLLVPPSTFGVDMSAGKFCIVGMAECADSGKLRERWLRQRVKELQLTSERLKLMLEECQIQQESLEGQLSKM